ncbi:putative mitochondrial protein [Cucumis melo var. makuwa]|uniref:Putative mitochondrial protein n=1 Tax=Cucumis melo var. makuwa TaxID=1194695 RepID=A0A5D3C4W9_CUCMM|nr:putative mitochondrial protein [Cucumis melo var. makuwa]
MLDTQHAWCLHSHAHDSRAALHNGCARMDGQGYTRTSQIRQTISTCARDSDGLRAFLNMLSALGSVWKFLYRSKSVMKALEGSICILADLQSFAHSFSQTLPHTLPTLIQLSRAPHNLASISIANNRVQLDKMKHVEIDRYFIKERLDNGCICILYTPSSQQIVDVRTKGLLRQSFDSCVSKLGTLNSQQECEKNTCKKQYGNGTPEEAGSPNDQGTQDSDVELVVSLSSEELEEVEVGEEAESQRFWRT